jgi:hypothetical protein
MTTFELLTDCRLTARDRSIRYNLIRMISRFRVALFFVYGAVLCIVALYLAGYGHGSYLLLNLAGAPFSLFGPLSACLACLLQWGLLAILMRRWKSAPISVIGFLILHYVAACFAVRYQLSPEDTDLNILDRKLPGFTVYLFAGLIWYLGGQIVFWMVALKSVFANSVDSGNAPSV